MSMIQSVPQPPYTHAVRQALQGVNNYQLEADLLFLEAWEMHPSPNLGMTLKAGQIRRANRELAAAIDAELKASSVAPRYVAESRNSASDGRSADHLVSRHRTI